MCDNDPYNEVSIAAVIRRPGARGPQALELLSSMRRRNYFAHVLALPVNTEIARVRGVQGYQLPKWRTQIEVGIGAEVAARIAATDGSPDLTLSAPLPAFRNVPSQSHMGASTMIHLVDGEWRQTSVQSNTLSFAQRFLPKDVMLKRSGGPMTELLDGLGASTILRLDVVKDAQLVLNMPRPLKAFD